MALTLYGRVGLLALAAILTAPRVASSAPIRIQVEASSDGGYFEDSSSGTGPVKSGIAFADRNSGFADIDNGPLALCSTSLSCSLATVDPWGLARAEANGTTGSLKVRAIAARSPNEGGAYARAKAELSDVINFLGAPPVIDLHLDLTQFSGDSEIRFSMSKQTSPETFVNYFLLDAADNGYEIWVNDELVEAGNSLPSVLNYSIENALFSGLGFDAFLSARASDDGQVIADSSVYLGIKGPYISANGFSYPGVAIDPTPTVPVPEPGTALLLLSGLSAFRARQMRRRREH